MKVIAVSFFGSLKVLATILATQERIKDNAKSTDEAKPPRAFSIVDDASTSVHGRSADVAKTASI